MLNENVIADRFSSMGIHHFSASSCLMPVPVWLFNYGYLSAEQRRAIVVGENAAAGTASHEGIQAVLSRGEDIDSAIKKALLTFDFHPANESQEKRVKFREDLPDIIHNGVNILSQDFTGAEEEHKIELWLDDVVLPIVGYVDLLKDDKLAEIKTKAARQGAIKKDGTRGWTKGSLPKEPSYEHVIQAAIYNKATGAEPNIVYVSAHDSIIFNPSNCDKLSDEYLSYAIQEMRRKCLVRQNLVAVSSDIKTLASLQEPDFNSFYWADEYMKEAKELWKL